MKRFLEIGKIVAVQGLKGEIRVDPWCDSPDFLCEFEQLYFNKGETPVTVVRARPHKNIVLMKIEGVDTPEDAQKLRGKILYMDREDVELEEGCYFVQDLIGLEVIDADDNTVYGRLSQVTATGANDVYHIKNGENEYLIPAIPDVIVKTDIENGQLLIRKMEGLFDI
ncbi:MAG: ribosome maturation factor RimM [Huintestinicola sp.]|uniref:ribosome maturation factor RimM n=1 Tax=Huintestinicola sp. TaxID=2981661 RepID=UPI003F02D125